MMTSKERLIAALDRKPLDRLPVTTHDLQKYFLNKYMGGCSDYEFYTQMGMDPVKVVVDWNWAPENVENWRIEKEILPDPQYHTIRYYFHTPAKTLTMVTQSNGYTTWVMEHMLKDKNDIEVLERYVPVPTANKELIQKAAIEYPDCLIRGCVPCLTLEGQPGCWQEFVQLYGTMEAILETYEDPDWVKELLGVLQRKKLPYIDSLEGCPYDILELGGGAASTTVISPSIFEEFVAPYDTPIIERMHEKGQRVAYHTCGGMMPILEQLAAMKPNALETFTPASMGGDADLAEAKRRIGDKVCMIGGFDQGHYYIDCTPEETRKYVRKCFEEAGEGGGYILSPSDHFFDADPELIRAYADEALKCVY